MDRNPTSPEDLAALRRLLDEINSTLGDFEDRPAQKATDRSSSGDTPLHKIAIWGDVPAARILMRCGAEVDAAGEDGDTPLHRAVAGGHTGMIGFLIESGADPDVSNRFGRSAAENAAESGRPELVAAMQRRN